MRPTCSLSVRSSRFNQDLSRWLVAASQFYGVYGQVCQRFAYQSPNRSVWGAQALMLEDEELSYALTQMRQQIKAMLVSIDQRSFSTHEFTIPNWGVLPAQTKQLNRLTLQLQLLLASTQLPQA